MQRIKLANSVEKVVQTGGPKGTALSLIRPKRIMGQLPPALNELFYDFWLDHYIPLDHLLRHIDAVLDPGQLREYLAPYYSQIGHPSINPELMMPMLIVGYSYGIRSERRLCEQRFRHVGKEMGYSL